MDLKCCSLTIF